MKKVRVMVRSRGQAGRQRHYAANFRHRIIHEYAEVDTEPFEKRQRLVTQLREQTEQARTLDDATAWDLKEFGYGG